MDEVREKSEKGGRVLAEGCGEVVHGGEKGIACFRRGSEARRVE
jgi:hypothetical protein